MLPFVIPEQCFWVDLGWSQSPAVGIKLLGVSRCRVSIHSQASKPSFGWIKRGDEVIKSPKASSGSETPFKLPENRSCNNNNKYFSLLLPPLAHCWLLNPSYPCFSYKTGACGITLEPFPGSQPSTCLGKHSLCATRVKGTKIPSIWGQF